MILQITNNLWYHQERCVSFSDLDLIARLNVGCKTSQGTKVEAIQQLGKELIFGYKYSLSSK